MAEIVRCSVSHDEGRRRVRGRVRGGVRGAQVHSASGGCLPRCRRRSGWSRRSGRCVLCPQEADAATAAFSGSAESTEVVRGSFAEM